MKDTLAIVGSHPNAKVFDFDRDDCDIIVFNEALKQEWIKRADYVIQIHLPAIFRNPNNRNDPNHYKWLCSGETPVILMQDKYEDIPRSEKYPLDEICAMFPNFDKVRHFTSSIAYCLAWGIYRGYKKIETWGVELETDTEYRYQQPGAMFWQGVAVGRGIVLEAHTKMFDAPLYGYEGEADIKYEEFDKRIEALQPHFDRAQADYLSALKETNAILASFIETGDKPEVVPDLVKKQAGLANTLALFDGAIQENKRYQGKVKAMLEEAQDFKFSRQEFEQSAQRMAMEVKKFETEANAAAGAAQVYFGQAAQERNHIRRRKKMQEFTQVLQQYLSANAKAGFFTGALRENQEYMGRLDALIKAAGGAKSEAVLLGK